MIDSSMFKNSLLRIVFRIGLTQNNNLLHAIYVCDMIWSMGAKVSH